MAGDRREKHKSRRRVGIAREQLLEARSGVLVGNFPVAEFRSGVIEIAAFHELVVTVEHALRPVPEQGRVEAERAVSVGAEQGDQCQRISQVQPRQHAQLRKIRRTTESRRAHEGGHHAEASCRNVGRQSLARRLQAGCCLGIVVDHRAIGFERHQIDIAATQTCQCRPGWRRKGRIERVDARQDLPDALIGEGGRQQNGLPKIGGHDGARYDRPRCAHTDDVGDHQHHGQRCDDTRPARSQRKGDGYERRDADEHPEQPVDRVCEQHDGCDGCQAHPPRQILRRHPQKARNLLPVPVKIHRPSEQRGYGDVAVAPEHEQREYQRESCQHAWRRRAPPGNDEQQAEPQTDEFRSQPVVGHDGWRGPHVVEAEEGIQQQQREDGLRPATPRRQGRRDHARTRPDAMYPMPYCVGVRCQPSSLGAMRSHGERSSPGAPL